MEITKVIVVNQNSLGFEIGETPKWRGEFTLEQVAEFNIKAGRNLKVYLLEMEDTFATVEFDDDEKTIVPITKVQPGNELFAPESSKETNAPNMDDTLRG